MNYIYAGTRASTKASALLSDTSYERLLGAQSTDESARILADTFIAPHLSDTKSLEESLVQAVSIAKQEVGQFVPYPEHISLFWAQYDFYNIAIIRKAELSGSEDIAPLLYTYGNRDPHELLEAYKSETLRQLSTDLDNLNTAIGTLEDAQQIDIEAEKAYLSFLTKQEITDSFLSDYTVKRIDLFNIENAKRYNETLHATLDEAPFISGGSVHKDRLAKVEAPHILTWLRNQAHDIFSLASVYFYMHRLMHHIDIIRALTRSTEARIPESERRSFIHPLF